MKGRAIATIGFAALFAACGGEPEPVAGDARLIERAREIHDAVLTLDSHIDIPLDFATETLDPGVRGEEQVDLVKMEEGGLSAGVFIVYAPQGARDAAGYAEARAQAETKFAAIRRMAETLYPDRAEMAFEASDVSRIHLSGKRAVMIGIENGYVIDRDLDLLDRYFERGARYVTLAHVGHNDIADSSVPRKDLGDGEAEHGGLSDFGRAAIARMNRLGMAIDVSHISRAAMMQAAALSKAPIIASHSAARALCDHPRNLDDAQLLAIRDSGGVAQIVAYDAYVKCRAPEKDAAIDALLAEFELKSPVEIRALSEERRALFRARWAALDETWPRATLAEFVDHIDYVVKLIGVDRVGIASDFGGGGGVVGWDDASETFNVTLELTRRGYGQDDIAKIWSGNFLRVMEEIARIAESIRTQEAPPAP